MTVTRGLRAAVAVLGFAIAIVFGAEVEAGPRLDPSMLVFKGAGAGKAKQMSSRPHGGGNRLVSVASRYVGGNPTGRSHLWCMSFVRLAMQKAGYPTINSHHSSAAFKYGPKVSKASARPGDIVYRSRKGGGHVEIFAGWANEAKTKYKAISGNSCGKRGRRRVCEVTRSVSKMHAVIRPRTS